MRSERPAVIAAGILTEIPGVHISVKRDFTKATLPRKAKGPNQDQALQRELEARHKHGGVPRKGETGGNDKRVKKILSWWSTETARCYIED